MCMKFLGRDLRNFFTNFDSSIDSPKSDDFEAIPASFPAKASIVSDSVILRRSNSDIKVFRQGLVQQPHGEAVLLFTGIGSWIDHGPGLVDSQHHLHPHSPHGVICGCEHWTRNCSRADQLLSHQSRTSTTFISFSV